jgi:chemosensory pili system protein ChpB (putative protein-glutamate methylesterase)
MLEAGQAPLRVAVISQSDRQRHNLRRVLESNGLLVVTDQTLTECAPGRLDACLADVLLIDLDESYERELTSLDVLIEQSSLPILFNDGDVSYLDEDTKADDWGRKLVSKLTALVSSAPGPRSRVTPPPSAPTVLEPAERPQLRVIATREQHGVERARRVWVLGASIGGPQAVKQFLDALPPYLPMAFVLVQHIGANFVGLLAEQLNRDSRFEVLCAAEGQVLCHSQVVVVPVDQRLVINRQGEMELHPATRGTYSPSIDLAMQDIAERYGADAGAILFSGMGDDGMRGAREIMKSGGVVWAQAAASCVISTMTDHVRHAGLVSFNGTPQELAERLVQRLQAGRSVIDRAGFHDV